MAINLRQSLVDDCWKIDPLMTLRVLIHYKAMWLFDGMLGLLGLASMVFGVVQYRYGYTRLLIMWGAALTILTIYEKFKLEREIDEKLIKIKEGKHDRGRKGKA